MSEAFLFPGTGVRTRQATLLAIDDYSLPLRRDLCPYIIKPTVRPQAVLTPDRDTEDRPDYICTFFYGAVLHDQGHFRMWYYACHLSKEKLGFLEEGPVCYAESDDGIHWVKPALGQVEWRGSRQNNVILLSDLHNEGLHVIKDEEDPDPARRYKMVYNYRPGGRSWSIRTASSPDGFHWTEGAPEPYYTFIEQASFYKHNGLYFVNGQMLEPGEGAHRTGRQAYAIVSPDFDHWVQGYSQSFTLPEPLDPAGRGHDKPYDQVHIGVGAASNGTALVGLYCIWHNIPYPTKDDWFGMGTTSGDFGLVVSNDGFHVREPVKGHVWLNRNESPAPQIPGAKQETILTQGNGILNVGDETRVYHGRWVNTDREDTYYSEVALATLPRDRWGALGIYPNKAEGVLYSAPITLPLRGCQVFLNADHADHMMVELLDERFVPLSSFSGAAAGTPGISSGFECPVTWPGGDLAAVGGATIRLRITLRRSGAVEPRLYAVYLK